MVGIHHETFSANAFTKEKKQKAPASDLAYP